VSVYQAGAASQAMLFSPWAANSSLGVPPGTAISWASTAALLSVSEELRTSPASCCSSLAAGGRWCQDTNNTTPAVDSGARAACTAVHRCCAGLYGLVRQTGGAGPQPHWLSMAPRDCQRVTREPGACAHASPMGAVPQAPAYQRARSELTWAAARHTGFMLTSPTKGPHSAAAGAPHAPAPRA